MRQLTKLEKTLIIALIGTVFILANLFGVSALMRQRRALQLDSITIKGEQAEAELWLAQKPKWLARKAWLDKSQPAASQPEAAQSTFFEELQKSARSRDLAIDEQGFGEVSETPHFKAVAVRMRVTGTLENTTRWLAAIQQPALFQAITSFSLKSEKEPPQVNVELQIAKYYRPNNGS